MTLPPVISIIIPVYNSAPLLEELYAGLRLSLEAIGRYELIFVDDASVDESLECLWGIAARDSNVRVATMTRNLGQQEATLHGLSLASGEYCATMDDDGQHPADLLPVMFDRLRDDDLDIVYAVPEGGQRTFLRIFGSAMRDRMFSILLPHSKGTRVGSYRIMTRRLVRRVLAGRGAFNYFSAMVFQEPTRATALTYAFRACRTGRSGYTFRKLFDLYWKIFIYYGPFVTKRPAQASTHTTQETHSFD